MPPRVQQRVFAQRPRRDEPDDLARHHRAAAALARFGRVLGLLADGDLEALADQPLQIGLMRADRHAGHRDVLAVMAAALGQRDVERACRLYRILEEQLVEVAHAVEQQIARMRVPDGEILRHHRRVACGSGGFHRRSAVFRQTGRPAFRIPPVSPMPVRGGNAQRNG